MGMRLNSFNIKGERCSGTTYLQKLVETNLKISYIQQEYIGWKHGYINYNVEGLRYSRDYLTIIIFRNVFDWLRSFYNTPHHMEGTTHAVWNDDQKPTFSEFISREVKQFNVLNKELLYERHPFYLTRPKNLLELRKWKIEHFLSYKNFLHNTYYVKYEDLVEMPEVILAEINSKWFNRRYKFENWGNYKLCREPFIPIKYPEMTPEDRDFIIKNTDWSLENQIGYSLPVEMLN